MRIFARLASAVALLFVLSPYAFAQGTRVVDSADGVTGTMTLPQAVNDANSGACPSPCTITFDPAVFATPRTITLGGGLSLFANGITIDGFTGLGSPNTAPAFAPDNADRRVTISRGACTPGCTAFSVSNITSNVTISGLVIQGFDTGIATSGTNTRIVGNWIQNNLTGIAISGQTNPAQLTTVGGAAAADRNIISGSSTTGIQVGPNLVVNTEIDGNFIGTDSTGTSPSANNFGIQIQSSASGTRIGVLAGNLIAGNSSHGIVIGSGSTVVQNNLIGVSGMGNTGVGVLINSGSNVVQQNSIRSNSDDGVEVSGSSSGNVIRGNIYEANGSLPISLLNFSAFDDPAANTDPGDGDTGGNGLQNYPVISSAYSNPQTGRVEVTFAFDSSATSNGSYIVELYSARPSGPNPLEQRFIEAQCFTGNNFSFGLTTDFDGSTIAIGDEVFLTATGYSSGCPPTTPIDGTSEISPAATVTLLPGIVTHTGDSGPGSLRQAILDANSGVCASSFGGCDINFAIPRSDGGFTGTVWVIRPATPLPALTTNDVYIDGWTQSSFDGTDTNPLGPEIVVNGSLLTSPNAVGFHLFSSLAATAESITIDHLVINGFADDGIRIEGSGALSRFHTIMHCYIGTDETGTTAVPNGRGVTLGPGAEDNEAGTVISFASARLGAAPTGLIGPGTPAGNLISGNAIGILIEGNATFNEVLENSIGTDRSESAPLPNGVGIHITGSASNNLIGGGVPGAESNVIAFNTATGVLVDTLAAANPIWGNSIHSNGTLGIDLAPAGVTANDPGDLDTGANDLQNFPVITSQTDVAGQTTINGTLNSLPNQSFDIDIYASTTPDPSGHGEGETYLDFVSVTTDTSGNASFTYTAAASHRWITTTATFVGMYSSYEDTSEFSAFYNTAPVANPDTAGTTAGSSVTTDVVANDTDAENDAIVALSGTSANGTVSCSGSTCTFTPSAGFTGTTTYTYTAQDAGFATSTGTVTVTVTALNAPPVAVDDTATTPSGTPVTTNVLSNDSDPEGGPLELFVASQGSFGSVTCGTVSCTYTPNTTSFFGTDSYTYTIEDAGGLSDTATVTVTVTNRPPVAEDDEVTVAPGETATFNVLTNDDDPEGETIRFDSISSPPSQGTVTCTSSGNCTYTAFADASGSDDFSYIVKDASNNPASGTVFIEFVTACPSDPILTSPADEETNVPLSGTFRWSGDGERFEIFYGPAGQGCSMSRGSTIRNDFAYRDLEQDTEYEWRVIARSNGCPSQASSCATFRTVRICNVAPPTPLAPLGGATVSSPITFQWTAVSGATEYIVFAERGTVKTELGRTAATSLTASLPDGSSSWHVVAIGVEGCGDLKSSSVSFAICNAPAPPLAAVVAEATSEQTYHVIWDPVANASRYQVIEATDPDFNNQQTFTTTKTSMAFTKDVTTPTAFYYLVRAFSDCFDGFGGTSPEIRVVIVPVPPERDPDPSANAPVGSDRPIVIKVFIAGEPERTFQYNARGDQTWMEVRPASGVLPPEGVVLDVIVDPDDLPNGTFTGTVILDLLEMTGSSRSTTHGGTTTKSSTVSINLVTPVLPLSPGPPNANSLIIPAVGHLDGLDARWRSDVRIANTSGALMRYLVTFNPANPQIGVKQTDVEVDPGATTALDDIVRAWYGVGSLGESSNGFLEIRPLTGGANLTTNGDDGPNVSLATVVSSRTYAQGQNGTLGEFIPGISFGRFVGLTEGTAPVLNLQQIAQNALYRTNIGVVEASGLPVSVLLSIYNSGGEKLKDIPLTLNPNEQRQLNSLLAEQGIELSDGRVEVQVVGGAGRVTAYAAVVDNRTKDQLFVPASILDDATASKYIMPGIADLNTGIALWRSDMHVFNGGEAAQDVTLTFYPQNLDGSTLTANLTVNPGEVKVLNNIVQSVFGTSSVGGAVHLTTPDQSSLVVTGRTYNQTPNGTLGLFVPAVTPDQALGLNEGALNVLQAEDSIRYRTNLGIAEVTGQPATVEIQIHLPNERVTPRIEVPLEANEFMQFPVLSSLGIGPIYNARISMRVIGGEGKITAYGSVVDMKTNDSTYVPAQ